jgi:hypothetical protein
MAWSPFDLPFRRSVRAGNFFYLSGALGNAPGERAVSGVQTLAVGEPPGGCPG